ncbi:MAG: hypothetical protein V1921_00055 [Candidatus Altiarchaeota archaeon]
MVTRGRKAQSGLEYMMTYGWALLIILVIGVLMWQMGVFDTTKSIVPGKSGFSEVRPFDWKATASPKQIEVYILNDAGTRVQLNEIYSTQCNGGIPVSLGGVEQKPADVYDHATVTGCSGFNDEAGEYYKIDLTINYTKVASGLVHLSTGDVWGPLE